MSSGLCLSPSFAMKEKAQAFLCSYSITVFMEFLTVVNISGGFFGILLVFVIVVLDHALFFQNSAHLTHLPLSACSLLVSGQIKLTLYLNYSITILLSCALG